MTGTGATLAHGNDARVDDDVEQRLEARGLDLGVHFGLPGVGRHQVGEALVGAAEIRQVDQVDRRAKGAKFDSECCAAWIVPPCTFCTSAPPAPS